MDQEYEIIVIGGGPAGYSLAIRLGQRGKRVAVVESDHVGGVCLNWGCVPSKALITTGQRLRWAKEGAAFGIRTEGVSLDLGQAQARSRALVHHHTSGVSHLLRENGAELILGRARLTARRTVEVREVGGTRRQLEATRAIVLATGARIRPLPGIPLDGERIVTAKEAVFFERVPEHLVVVGGGVIGVELGSVYRTLGAEVTIVELGDRLLPGTDDDLVRVVSRELERSGVRILPRTAVKKAERTLTTVRLELDGPDAPQALEASHVLLAAGFVPSSADLGLDEVGVVQDARGHVQTDARLETNVAGIFAIGDVAGPPYLAHKAYKEAEVLAEILCDRPLVRDWRAMPAVTFGMPEIATVGLNEAEARARYGEPLVGKVPFSAFARAGALGETAGFVKVIATPSGQIVGAGVVGTEASELIAELTLAIEMGASLEDLALTVHAHPTLAEAVHEAAEMALGQAVHVLNRPHRRRGQAPERTAEAGHSGLVRSAAAGPT